MRTNIRSLSIVLILILTVSATAVAASSDEPFVPASTAMLGESLAEFERSEEIPLLRFGEAREVLAELRDASGAKALPAGLGVALSVDSGQLDTDGVLDLVVGYMLDSGGALVIYRGNPDFLMSPRIKDELAREKGIEIPAFLGEAMLIELPMTPDFVGVGDFNGDGAPDVVSAQRGAGELMLLPGGVDDCLSGQIETITLPGALTALAVGEVNRFDYLQDIVVGVTTLNGPKVLVFEGPNGALAREPEVFRAAAPVTDIVMGHINGDGSRDIAAASSTELLIITGRDRKLALSQSVQAEVPVAVVKSREMGAEITSLALGNFNGDHRHELAVLGADGVLEVVDFWEAERVVESVSIGLPGEGAVLRTARVSGLRYDDVLVLDGEAGTLEVLSHNVLSGAKSAGRDWHRLGVIKAYASLGATLAARFDYDALDDLVFLGSGAQGPATMVREPLAVFTVNATDNVNDGVCDAAHCSLREAQSAADASPGVDTINFDVGFAAIQATGAGIGTFSEAVIIDGTQGTPPLTHFTEIDGSGATAGPIFSLLGPSTTLTRLIVGGHPSGYCVQFDSADNSLMTLSRIGVGLDGLTDIGCSGHGVAIRQASGVDIGGTGFSTKNVIGGNGRSGIAITGLVDDHWAASDNWVMGNYIGTGSSGAQAIQNSEYGVWVYHAADNHIGGLQRGNVISGNSWSGVYDLTSEGTTVGGNLIGLDVTGSSAIPNSSSGVLIYKSTTTTIGGGASTVRNIISGNTGDGIRVTEAESAATEIFGNYIGTDITGASAIPNGESGVEVSLTAGNGVSVGGASSGSGNLISGNGSGVFANSDNGVTIQGNLIGSDATGAYAIPNWAGVVVFGDGVLVGGTGPLEGNLISGSTAHGIRVSSAGSVTIQGNRIGTDGSGSGPLGNGEQGIKFDSTTDYLSVIGGNIAGAGNVVAFNGGAGVDFPLGDARVRRNSIHSNAGLGIDLASDGVTSNDLGDGDYGPNHRQNFPVIVGVVRGATDVTIGGTLNSMTSRNFEIEFFSSSSCDASGHGEGEVYLGYTAVSTDAGGDAAFNVTLPLTVSQGAFITATATYLDGFWGFTSEFSACFQVGSENSLIFADGFESGGTTAWN